MDGGLVEDDDEAMDVDPVRHTLVPVGVHV
jgi:hypothetical protein